MACGAAKLCPLTGVREHKVSLITQVGESWVNPVRRRGRMKYVKLYERSRERIEKAGELASADTALQRLAGRHVVIMRHMYTSSLSLYINQSINQLLYLMPWGATGTQQPENQFTECIQSKIASYMHSTS